MADEKFFIEGGIKALIWFPKGNFHDAHLTSNDPRLRLPGSNQGPGLHLAFNDNPMSANYHPVALKRCLAAYQEQEQDHSINLDDVFVRDRHIQKRTEVIGEYLSRRPKKKKITFEVEVDPSRESTANRILEETRARIGELSSVSEE